MTNKTTLAALSMVVAACLAPVAAAHGQGFVYATNTTSDEISQYRITASGALEPLTPPSVRQTFPLGVTASPDGRSVYVASGYPDLRIYQYDVGASGALTAKSPASVSGGISPYALIVGRDGRSLYASGYQSVLQFDVERTAGA